MARIHLIHGFNTWDNGDKTIGQLQPFLEADGHEVIRFKYGWTFLAGAWLWNDNRAERLAKQVKPGDIAIAHSNGASILHRACRLLPIVPFLQVIYINGALDRDLVPLWNSVKSMVVYYSPHDQYVTKARWIPGVIWGDQGAVGCTVNHPSIKNFDESKILSAKIEHSESFKRLYCSRFYGHLSKQILER